MRPFGRVRGEPTSNSRILFLSGFERRRRTGRRRDEQGLVVSWQAEECNPTHYTITFWIYPDSFDDFNRVRKELYQLGYSVAARPMPEGRRMGARRTAANRTPSKSNGQLRRPAAADTSRPL